MEQFFSFEAHVNGCPQRIAFRLPVMDGSDHVITNQYRPDIYSKSDVIVGYQAGESIAEFYNDCNNIITAASHSSEEGMDALVAGLMTVVKAHIARCGRLIFGDLLIYIDCFTHILKGGGVKEQDLRDYYSVSLGSLVSFYLQYIKDDSTLAPFSETQIFIIVKQHVNQVCMRLNGQPLFY